MALSWTCPYCNRPTTLNGSDYEDFSGTFSYPNKDGHRTFSGRYIVCPNEDCKNYSLSLSLWKAKNVHGYIQPDILEKTWSLIPISNAKVFPDYIPPAIIKDYEEACAIKDSSAKAAATLARRCLQGMIRNFWGIKRKNLKREIDAIKKKVDPLTWQAIEAVRKVGNIGAHMEKNIDLIVEVEPEEAVKLIKLIEILIQDWYINKNERELELQAISQIAENKANIKKQSSQPSGSEVSSA